MGQEHPNWIEERAKCDMQKLWADLCDLMVENVERINAEAEERGWSARYSKPTGKNVGRTTRYVGQNEAAVCRWEYESGPAHVLFTFSTPDRHATLTTRWEPTTCQCRLLVTLSPDQPNSEQMDFPHDELWKAVQSIVEPFFFTS